MGRRLAVISWAWFCRMVVRAACSEWLCWSAMAIAWSSVTRTGGVGGGACAGGCAATGKEASSANAPNAIGGRHFSALNFASIVTFLAETFESPSESSSRP